MDFWSLECAIRGGPTLTHVHDDALPMQQHGDCPCVECGLTPNRYANLIRGMPEIAGKVTEPQMRHKTGRDDVIVVLDSPTRTRLMRYVAVEDRRGYR